MSYYVSYLKSPDSSEDQYQKMYAIANQDTLTKLSNRYHLETVKTEIVRSASSTKHPTCFLLIDIDYFKKINDQFGHSIGDAVLSAFAQRLSTFFADTAFRFRVGGEEFLVILERTPLDKAQEMANGFREYLTSHPIHYFPVTVSIGLALLGKNGNFNSAYISADNALYKAKTAGRNQLCIDSL